MSTINNTSEYLTELAEEPEKPSIPKTFFYEALENFMGNKNELTLTGVALSIRRVESLKAIHCFVLVNRDGLGGFDFLLHNDDSIELIDEDEDDDENSNGEAQDDEPTNQDKDSENQNEDDEKEDETYEIIG